MEPYLNPEQESKDPYPYPPYAEYAAAGFRPNLELQNFMRRRTPTPTPTPGSSVPASIPIFESSLLLGPSLFSSNRTTYAEKLLEFQQTARFGPSDDPIYWQLVESQSQQRLNLLAVHMEAMLKEAMDKAHKKTQESDGGISTLACSGVASGASIVTPIQIHENFLVFLSSIAETFKSQNADYPNNYESCKTFGIPGQLFIDGYYAFLKVNNIKQEGATHSWIVNELFKFYQKFEATRLVPDDILKNNPKCKLINYGRIVYHNRYKCYVMDIHELEAIMQRFYPAEFDKKCLVPGFSSWLCYRET